MIWIIIGAVYLAIGAIATGVLHLLASALGGEGLRGREWISGVLLWPVHLVRYVARRWGR